MLAFDRALHDRDRLKLALAFDRTSARSFDVDGRMHVKTCRISKANVCPYYGREIPNYQQLALDANRVYMMYRDPAELEKAAPHFENLQLLYAHTPVKAADPKVEITVGTFSGISFDGKYLVADRLTVWTKDGIALVETDEQSELSSSYYWRADMNSGVSPEGVAFDGVMRDIKGNHVALVKEGRAGPDVAVNDALPPELHMTIKRPHLLARLLALGVVTAPSDDAARLALDAKLSEMTAKDEGPDDEVEDDPENPSVKRKKMNPGKGTPGTPGGALASDAAIDAAILAKGYISKDDAAKLANDAADSAVKRVNDLHVAREAVKPLVGIVAMDSADEVYKFALGKEGVKLDGVHASAYPALVAERVAAKSNAPVVPTGDAAPDVSAAFPGLGRFHVAG